MQAISLSLTHFTRINYTHSCGPQYINIILHIELIRRKKHVLPRCFGNAFARSLTFRITQHRARVIWFGCWLLSSRKEKRGPAARRLPLVEQKRRLRRRKSRCGGDFCVRSLFFLIKFQINKRNEWKKKYDSDAHRSFLTLLKSHRASHCAIRQTHQVHAKSRKKA